MALAKTLFVFFGYCATAFAKPYPNLDGTNIQFGATASLLLASAGLPLACAGILPSLALLMPRSALFPRSKRLEPPVLREPTNDCVQCKKEGDWCWTRSDQCEAFCSWDGDVEAVKAIESLPW
ncbi:hypothetical protein ACCO45_012476 [Purpureocillium lilacinum]|uniref:Uncharacterized protein n=1 Tax=Purpureocillium lilacinum TaxID=33203 RepID=A0ACC4D959_PURLI